MAMSKRFRLEEKLANAKNHLENIDEAYIKLRFRMDQLKADMQKANKAIRAAELELEHYDTMVRNDEVEFKFSGPEVVKPVIRISGAKHKLQPIEAEGKHKLRLPCSHCSSTYKWNPEEEIICTACDDAEKETEQAILEDYPDDEPPYVE